MNGIGKKEPQRVKEMTMPMNGNNIFSSLSFVPCVLDLEQRVRWDGRTGVGMVGRKGAVLVFEMIIKRLSMDTKLGIELCLTVARSGDGFDSVCAF